jgi:hypothetical protein
MSSSLPSLLSSSLGDDTPADDAPEASTSTAPSTAAQSVDSQPTSTGKKRSTEAVSINAHTDCVTTTTTTTVSSRSSSAEMPMPPASSSSSTNMDGDGGSSKRLRTEDTTVELPAEEWTEAVNTVFLEQVGETENLKTMSAWNAVAVAVNQKCNSKITVPQCLLHALALESQALALKSQALEEEQLKCKKLQCDRTMIGLRMILCLPEGHYTLKCTAKDSSHVYGKAHAAANAIEQDFPHVDITKDGLIQKLDDINSCVPSVLNMKFWDRQPSDDGALDEDQHPVCQPFIYTAEADIVGLAQPAVTDAINILQACDLETYRELSVRLEMQLFSYKPDILVVRCNNNPIFAVEVKKPLPKKNQKGLAGYGAVLGQTFDYLELLEALGYRNSLVVTTSFEESFACWTHSCTNNEEEGGEAEGSPASSPDDNNGQAILAATTQAQSSDARQAAANTNMESPPVSQVSSTADNIRSETPPELKTPPDDNILSGDVESSALLFAKDPDRTMSRSKVIKSHELVWLLCRSIAWAVKRGTQPTKTILKLQQEKVYKFRKVLQVTKGKYDWGSLTVKINNNAAETGSKSSDVKQNYYIIGILGRGDTSSVYHAVDSHGNQVAIKVYVKITDDKGVCLGSTQFKVVAKAAVTREAERLVLFYDFLTGKVHVAELFNGFWCLVMPLFQPVPMNERQIALGQIEKTLGNHFFKENNPLKYSNGDVRWRHVGLYRDGSPLSRCVLYDLADLEPLAEDENIPALIKKYVEILQRRMGSEETAASPIFQCEALEQT